MKTAVMTDTNSGITIEEGRRLGIFVLPMPVIVDGRDYLENVDITREELYTAILEGRDVCTSQPSPDALISMWKEIIKQGYDSIIHIPMSSGLSGSCQMAACFAQEFDGKVQVADNHRIAVTLRDSVMDAKMMADQGKSAEEIKEYLENSDSRIFIAVKTLDLLKKSGRVTPAAAAVANIFHIMPILSIKEGKLDAYAKARGVKACEKRICDAVEQEIEERFPGVDLSLITIGAAGTFADPAEAERWLNTVRARFPQCRTYYNALSCSIACHVSVDAIGIGVSCAYAENAAAFTENGAAYAENADASARELWGDGLKAAGF